METCCYHPWVIYLKILFSVSSLRSFSLSHIVRQGNVIAHALAQRARISFSLLVWMEFTPSDIDSIIAINFPTS